MVGKLQLFPQLSWLERKAVNLSLKVGSSSRPRSVFAATSDIQSSARIPNGGWFLVMHTLAHPSDMQLSPQEISTGCQLPLPALPGLWASRTPAWDHPGSASWRPCVILHLRSLGQHTTARHRLAQHSIASCTARRGTSCWPHHWKKQQEQQMKGIPGSEPETC